MENIKLYAICSANIINKLKSNELVWRWRTMAKQRWRRCLQSRKSISIGVANGNVRLNRYFNLILVHIECNSIGSHLVYVFFFSFFRKHTYVSNCPLYVAVSRMSNQIYRCFSRFEPFQGVNLWFARIIASIEPI